MFLIDKPYESDFLIQTLKENNYTVVATKVARELVVEASLKCNGEKQAIATLNTNPSKLIN